MSNTNVRVREHIACEPDCNECNPASGKKALAFNFSRRIALHPELETAVLVDKKLQDIPFRSLQTVPQGFGRMAFEIA